MQSSFCFYTLRFFPFLVFVVTGFSWLPAAHADLGPYPPEVTAWTDDIKEQQRAAGRNLVTMIADAAAKGEKELLIPKGDYRFNQTEKAHVILSKLHDITLDFQGSNLWFETEITGLDLIGCTNVTVRNVFMDWDPLPFFQGKVTAISQEDDTFDFLIDSGYERVLPGLSKDPATTKWSWRGIVFAGEELKPHQQGFGVGFSWDRRGSNGSYQVKFRGYYNVHIADGGVAVGDPMVILARMGRAVKIEDCNNCVLEDVTLYSSPFIGFVGNQGSGTIFRRCHILRRPNTNRLLAGNADGINCANMSKGPLIEDCSMQTIGDDFVNIHGFYSRVLLQESPTQIVCSRIAYQGAITQPVLVEFYDRATMRLLGTCHATAEPIQWKIDPNNCQADLNYKWHSGEASGLDYGKTVPAHRLTLDAPLDVKGDAIVSCEAFSCPGTVVRNCDFHGSLARGIRLQSPETTIENNHLSTIAGGALTMNGQAAYWGEGTYVHSTVVSGNTFTDSSLFDTPGGTRAALTIQEGDNSDPQHLPHNIQIKNNTFVRPGGIAILARGVDHLTISGNHISEYGNLPPNVPSKDPAAGAPQPFVGWSAIDLEHCTDVVLQNNEIGKSGPNAAASPITTVDVKEAKPAAKTEAK